jgi:undecaprenyl-diphosphatase
MTQNSMARATGIWLGTGLVSLGILVWLTAEVVSGATRGFDFWVRDGIHHVASPALTELAQAITTLGSVLFLSLAFGLSLIAFLLARLWQEAVRLTYVMAGAIGLENGMKFSIRRVRPDAFFGVDPTTYSFPSGHSLLSFCFYLTLVALMARHLPALGRRIVWCAAALLILAIGLSRIYLGVHYPTDVIGGFLTAAFWTSLVLLIVSWRSKAPSEAGRG